jgi:hypothetical protein
MEIITPEERIRQLQQLEEQGAKIRRRATLAAGASVVLAALVLGGLIFAASRKLDDLQAQVTQKQGEFDKKQQDFDALEIEIKSKQTQLAQLEGKVAQALDKNAGPQQRTAALNDLAVHSAPRVYLQITDELDRKSAEMLNVSLQKAGFRLLGVECRGDAISIIKVADVRYYKAKDKDTAVKLAETVKNARNQEVKLKYLSEYENDPRVHQNDFELWLPHEGTDLSGCTPGRK